jgi:hypothetical protein
LVMLASGNGCSFPSRVFFRTSATPGNSCPRDAQPGTIHVHNDPGHRIVLHDHTVNQILKGSFPAHPQRPAVQRHAEIRHIKV